MKQVTLSDQQLNNLKIFLGKCSLTGLEVAAFNEIVALFFGTNNVNPVVEKDVDKEEE